MIYFENHTSVRKKEFHMPSIDMPIKDLENYMGTNPRPEDFDAFWNSSIQQMLSVFLIFFFSYIF